MNMNSDGVPFVSSLIRLEFSSLMYYTEYAKSFIANWDSCHSLCNGIAKTHVKELIT